MLFGGRLRWNLALTTPLRPRETCQAAPQDTHELSVHPNNQHDANAHANTLKNRAARTHRLQRRGLWHGSSRSSVRAGHAPPDGPELGTPDLLLSLVDVAEALAKVEVGGRLVRHVLDLDERGVLVLVAEAALVAKDGTLDVQPARLLLPRLVLDRLAR